MPPSGCPRPVLLAALLAACVLAGCGHRPPARPQASAVALKPAAVVAAPQAVATAAARRHAHHAPRAVAHRRRPAIPSPAHTNATLAAAARRGLVDSTCNSTRNGLRKVIGPHLSPADTSAAPALVARLLRLQHDQVLGPQSGPLAVAIAGATSLAKQWGAVLVIGPDDQLRAERLGRKVIAAVGAVNAAAEAAGLGTCVIPLS